MHNDMHSSRRRFLMQSCAVAGSLVVSAPTAWAESEVPLRPDGSGLARLGLVVPANEITSESEFVAMAPQGVSIHASRVRIDWSNPKVVADPPGVDAAVELLAGIRPRAILYVISSSSYFLGLEGEAAFRARLEARAQGVPVVLAAEAASQALTALDIRRVAIVHPPWFPDELNDRGGAYFRSRGFDVVSCARLAPLRKFGEVPASEVRDWIAANTPRNAEAVLVAGNGLRAVGAIAALEAMLGRPVLTANQVMLWQGLRVAGVSSGVDRYGRLFSQGR